MRIFVRGLLRLVIGLMSGLAVRGTEAVVDNTSTSSSFVGTWRGEVVAPNTRAEIACTFEPSTKGLRVRFSLPAMFVDDMPLGVASIDGNTYSLAALGIRLTLEGDRLVGTFANPLLQVELRRGDPIASAPPAPALPPAPTVAWTRDLEAETWASPVARDGLIYLGSADGKFCAIRASDGQVQWTWSGAQPLYGTALVTEESAFFVDQQTELIALDRHNGQLRWKRPLHDAKLSRQPAPANPTFNRRTATPLLVDGILYVGSTDSGVYAIVAATGEVRWRHALPAAIYAGVTLDADTLIAATFDGSLAVLDRSTGAEIRRTQLPGPLVSAPVVAGDTLIIGCRDYMLYGLRRTDLSVAWRNTYWFSWVESVPQLVDGVIYIGGSDYRRVSALDPATGKALWAADVRGLTWGTPVVTDRWVFAGTSAQNPAALKHEGGITALDRRTGQVSWRHITPLPEKAARAGYLGSLVLADGKIIGAGFDGQIVAFSAESPEKP